MGWAGNGRGQRWGSAFPHYREKPREHRAGQLRPRARSDPTQGPLLHVSRAQLLADRCRSIPRPTRHTAVGRLSEVTAAGPRQHSPVLRPPSPPRTPPHSGRGVPAPHRPLPFALPRTKRARGGRGTSAFPARSVAARLWQRCYRPSAPQCLRTASAPGQRSQRSVTEPRAGPPCWAVPNRAAPSRAEPSQGQLGGAGLCRGEPGEIPWRRAGPNGAKPGGAVQGYAVPCRAEPNRAEPSR